MLPALTVRDWARRLFAYESVAAKSSQAQDSAAFRVYEKLRLQLSGPVGKDAFQTLASRALMLASAEAPELSALSVLSDGRLEGRHADFSKEEDKNRETGVVLIAHLLYLILTMVGETTTRRLMADLRHQAGAGPSPSTETGTAQADRETSATIGGPPVQGFENILLEVDRLRTVSEALEALGDKHPDMAEGLVSVAGNIRNIATVLDVFVLIRSKDEGAETDAANPIAGYLM